MKFKYGNKVKIIAGFYEGQVGKVIKSKGLFSIKYRVYIKEAGYCVDCKESSLEKT